MPEKELEKSWKLKMQGKNCKPSRIFNTKKSKGRKTLGTGNDE